MVNFYTRYSNLKLTVQPPLENILAGKRQLVPGHVIRFSEGKYSTSDKTEINFIRSHRWYGTRITETTEDEEKMAAGMVLLPCDFRGCDYVAEAKSGEEALRKLRGHQSAKGHYPGARRRKQEEIEEEEELTEEEDGEEEDEDEEDDYDGEDEEEEE